MNLISEDYLMHHGVKGMKWGVRHDPERVGRVRTARSNYRSAKRQYSKDFNSAYNYSSRHMVSQFIKKSPTYAESNKRWDKAAESAKNVSSAKQELKSAKSDLKKIGYSKGYRKVAKTIGNSPFGKGALALNKAGNSARKSLDSNLGKVSKKTSYSKPSDFFRQAGKNFVQNTKQGADFYKKSYSSIKSGKPKEIGKHYVDWLNQDMKVLGVTGTKTMKRKRYMSGMFNPIY